MKYLLNKKIKKICFLFISFIFLLQPFCLVKAEDIASRLSGYILLQVENNGEAWYVNPQNQIRYYLGRPEDAFRVMKNLGIGITNENLNKIPVGLIELSGNDSDGDGLSNDQEVALGTDINKSDTDEEGRDDTEEIQNNYNPLGSGYSQIDYNFSQKQKGRIFLQVESNGEAWYVNPSDEKRYFLGRPEDAFGIMRNLGLGISNNDIAKIRTNIDDYTEEESNSLRIIEQKVHNLINDERRKQGLPSLAWNEEVAQVAREHSENLARENRELTHLNYTCDFPFIHHEGYDFGLYHDDRLANRSIYYSSRSAENIALVPRVSYLVSYESSELEQKATNCSYRRNTFNKTFEEALKYEENDDKKVLIIKEEINKRKEALKDEEVLNVVKEDWINEDELAKETVEGWMNSLDHRANILTAEYNQTGIGASFVNSYLIITQVFITRAYCGYKYGVCCQEEGYYPYCYSPMSCYNNICQ